MDYVRTWPEHKNATKEVANLRVTSKAGHKTLKVRWKSVSGEILFITVLFKTHRNVIAFDCEIQRQTALFVEL